MPDRPGAGPGRLPGDRQVDRRPDPGRPAGPAVRRRRPRGRGPAGPVDPRDLRRGRRARLPRLGGAGPRRPDGPARRRVLATGGGAILREANRRALRDFGFVAWLTADPETLARRLRASRRGVDDRPALTAGRAPWPRSPTSSPPGRRSTARWPTPRSRPPAGPPSEVADAVLDAWSRDLAGRAPTGVTPDDYLWHDPR